MLSSSACPYVYEGIAKGSGDFVLPPEAGFLVGGTSIAYMVVEVHVNNPNLVVGINFTRLARAHTSSNLRRFNAGTMVLGDPFGKLTQVTFFFHPSLSHMNYYHHFSTDTCILIVLIVKLSIVLIVMITITHTH
jgi:hypothetical protein